MPARAGLAAACRDDIRKDPVFRAQFHTMCANIGVDPLASNKGVWAQVLGFGDFYYELGVQIVEACLATRSLNGGLMDMQSLMRYVAVSDRTRVHYSAACKMHAAVKHQFLRAFLGRSMVFNGCEHCCCLAPTWVLPRVNLRWSSGIEQKMTKAY